MNAPPGMDSRDYFLDKWNSYVNKSTLGAVSSTPDRRKVIPRTTSLNN